jgi:predicted dinucleotide-binding enzyme
MEAVMARPAIIGSGNIGSALAQLFARADVPVDIANTRGPASIPSFGDEVHAVPLEEALESDLLFLAIPILAVAQFGKSRPDWSGKTVVDAMNAHYAPGSAEILQGRLSTHYVAEQLPGAAVVKAFNQLPSAVLAAAPTTGRRVVFVATDTPAAGDRIAALAGDLGLAAIQLGRIDDGGRLIQAPNALVLRNLIEVA